MIGKCLVASAALWVLALLPQSGYAQPDMSALARDTHRFRQMFNALDCKPISSLQEFNEDWNDTVLVVLGDVAFPRNFSFGRYVLGGGSLLIATDRTPNRDDLSEFGVTLRGVGKRAFGDLAVLVREELGYHNLTDCPFVVPTPELPQLFYFGKDPLDKVATNRSGYFLGRTFEAVTTNPRIRLTSPDNVIARFPSQARYSNYDADVEGMIFALAKETGPGRVLLMADHSVFINAMLVQSDNQNAVFAYGCVDWLTEQGKRKKVLFINEGHLQSRFDTPLRMGSDTGLPPPEVIVGIFDQVMAGLEKENRFNELIQSMAQSVSRDRALFLLILSATVFVAVILFQRLNAARQRREAGIVPVATSVQALERGRAIHEQRLQAMTGKGNYWEAAHELALDVFEPLLAETRPGSRLRIKSTGSFWQSRHVRRQIEAAWQLAIDPQPRRCSKREWLAFHAFAGPLRDDIAQGKVFLAMPS